MPFLEGIPCSIHGVVFHPDRRVGAGLRERVGYRGAFTVDGVLAAQGFLPTELNPRLGAGLSTMTRDLPGLPVGLLDRVLIEGEPVAFAADGGPADGCCRSGRRGSGGSCASPSTRAGCRPGRRWPRSPWPP